MNQSFYFLLALLFFSFFFGLLQLCGTKRCALVAFLCEREYVFFSYRHSRTRAGLSPCVGLWVRGALRRAGLGHAAQAGQGTKVYCASDFGECTRLWGSEDQNTSELV